MHREFDRWDPPDVANLGKEWGRECIGEQCERMGIDWSLVAEFDPASDAGVAARARHCVIRVDANVEPVHNRQDHALFKIGARHTVVGRRKLGNGGLDVHDRRGVAEISKGSDRLNSSLALLNKPPSDRTNSAAAANWFDLNLGVHVATARAQIVSRHAERVRMSRGVGHRPQQRCQQVAAVWIVTNVPLASQMSAKAIFVELFECCLIVEVISHGRHRGRPASGAQVEAACRISQNRCMAEPLKNSFGPEMVHGVGEALGRVWPEFDAQGFSAHASAGFDELELTARARQIAAAMAGFLPQDRRQAIDILVASLGPERENCDPDDVMQAQAAPEDPMAGFFYMAHGYFIADHGEGHFDRVMVANYELTKRFTSEFSIRTPLRDHPDATLKVLKTWAQDPNVHVRRLVSEGTRPRLPWSFRLKEFQADPAPVLKLLELLKDDPVEYVRRSVANNLNDIAKDHPALVTKTAARWWSDGDGNRRRLIRHGLRTLIKAGDPDALGVLGYGKDSPATVAGGTIEPGRAAIGHKIKVQIEIANPSKKAAGALVDLQVHFVKANGTTSPKVFKGAELDLAPGQSGVVRKTISVAQHTTRKHYPGEHVVAVLLNGVSYPIGSFTLTQ